MNIPYGIKITKNCGICNNKHSLNDLTIARQHNTPLFLCETCLPKIDNDLTIKINGCKNCDD